jgi:hypothetical protein
MMDDITWAQSKMIGDNRASLPAAVPVHDEGITIPMLQPCKVARLTTKDMLALTETAPGHRSFLAADGATKGDPGSSLSALMCVYACLVKHLEDALPGYSMLFGKDLHGNKVSFIGSNNVNFLIVCQSNICHDLFLLSLIVNSLHTINVVVKGNIAHKQSYQTKWL